MVEPGLVEEGEVHQDHEIILDNKYCRERSILIMFCSTCFSVF